MEQGKRKKRKDPSPNKRQHPKAPKVKISQRSQMRAVHIQKYCCIIFFNICPTPQSGLGRSVKKRKIGVAFFFTVCPPLDLEPYEFGVGQIVKKKKKVLLYFFSLSALRLI
jgi:hypothetical protein